VICQSVTEKKKKKRYRVCVDSGANKHFLKDIDLVRRVLSGKITVNSANEEVGKLNKCVSKVLKVGKSNFFVQNPIYAPMFSHNLLSASELEEAGHRVIFEKDKTGLKSTNSRIEVSTGEVIHLTKQSGLYFFDVVVSGEQHEVVAYSTKALIHQRAMHLGRNDCNCESCLRAKGQRKPHRKKRKPHLKATVYGRRHHVDTKGPIPIAALFGEKYLVQWVDDATGEITNYGCKTKSEIKKLVKKHCLRRGRPFIIRSDNGTEFMGGFDDECEARGIIRERTSRYNPQENGNVERANRTIFDSAMASILHLDKRLWLLACEASAYVYNLMERSSRPSVYEMKHGAKPDTSHLRVFGCRCFYYDPHHKATEDRYKPATFVGYTDKQAYRCLYFDNGKPVIVEEKDVKFHESVFTMLSEEELVFPWPEDEDDSNDDETGQVEAQQQQQNSESQLNNDTTNSVDPAAERAGGDAAASSMEDADNFVKDQTENFTIHSERGDSPKQLENSGAGGDSSPKIERSDSWFWEGESDSEMLAQIELPESADEETPLKIVPRHQQQSVSEKESSSDEEVALQPVLPRNYGKQEKIPGSAPTTPVRSTIRDHIQSQNNPAPPLSLSPLVTGDETLDMLEEEQQANQAQAKEDRIFANFAQSALAQLVTLTEKQALNGPMKEKFEEQLEVEWKNFMEKQAFEDAEFSDMRPGERATPMKLVYQDKERDDKVKVRGCILGNLQPDIPTYEKYSPVANYSTFRLLLGLANQEGFDDDDFDLTACFLNTPVDERVFVRPPTVWQKRKNVKLWKLKKWVYGAKKSPRKWTDYCCAQLEKDGWKRSQYDPGLYWKDEGTERVYLLLYVDDGFMVGPKNLAQQEKKKILEKFPGTNSSRTVDKDGVERFRFVGVEVVRDKKKKTVKLHQQPLVEKLLEKFNVKETAATPITEALTNEGPKNTVFPYRMLVGSLMFLGVSTRPDLSFSIKELSRFLESPSESTVQAGLRVLK